VSTGAARRATWQGAVVALAAALRSPTPPGGLILAAAWLPPALDDAGEAAAVEGALRGVPALVLAGERDLCVPPERSQALAERLSAWGLDCRFEVRGAGLPC
jgi:predicted esterase